MSRVSTWVNVPGIVVVAAVVVAWQVLVDTGVIDFEFVPTPIEVGEAIVDLTSDGTLPEAVLHTLSVVLLASAMAVVIGILLGLALGLSRTAYAYGMATVDFLRTVPIVALIPVALLVWGPAAITEIVVATFAATWAMVVNTSGAFRTRNPRLRDVARTFQLSHGEAVRKIWLPSVMPALLVGARLAVVTAMIVAILAETLANPAGLGWGLIKSQEALQSAELWAYAVVTGWFGYLLNVALIHGVRALSPGGRENPGLIGA